MAALITAVGLLIASLALLGFVLLLHRLAKPIGHALMNLSLNAAGKRLSRIVKLAEEGREILTGPDSNGDQVDGTCRRSLD